MHLLVVRRASLVGTHFSKTSNLFSFRKFHMVTFIIRQFAFASRLLFLKTNEVSPFGHVVNSICVCFCWVWNVCLASTTWHSFFKIHATSKFGTSQANRSHSISIIKFTRKNENFCRLIIYHLKMSLGFSIHFLDVFCLFSQNKWCVSRKSVQITYDWYNSLSHSRQFGNWKWRCHRRQTIADN